MFKISRAIRMLIWLFLAGHVAFFTMAWSATSMTLAGLSMQLNPVGMGFDEAVGLATIPRLVGALVALPYLVTLGFGVWRLDQLLRINNTKTMFTAQSIDHLRAFVGATTFSAIYSILETPLRGLVWRHLGGFPQVHIEISVSSAELTLMLVCAVCFLVTSLMQEARSIALENESFV